ncbi:hypothetical protein GDO86_007624 [Hymenochirus boettgeri]|uniref:Calponin-homology (CH) domain-containing protein n=1 Tax=Hymenochirus boettgeri TaxID=247094 RepID=A0A8T2IUH2_9PIPI|nr:hypothetical protein GDO86_007624 [Hymenochirus boettgeri]
MAARPAMLRISPPGPPAKLAPEDPPTLSLTHFSRPPFVSFGCVSPGSVSRSVLLLHNPNPEPATVVVLKFPNNRGFGVSETETLIQPLETIPLNFTWTPLEEGNVRELVTFIVNDVVKYQAVLLGQAEMPAKKKRSIWNKRKVKKSPTGPKKSTWKQKDLDGDDHKNTVSRVAVKGVNGRMERVRSPLQYCENLALHHHSPSPVRESRLSTENRVPVQTINTADNKLDTFTPGSLRRSKTYSLLCTVEYSESTKVHKAKSKFQTDVYVEEEWILDDHKLKKHSMSPITPIHSQNHNIACTPDILVPSTVSSFHNSESVKPSSHIGSTADKNCSIHLSEGNFNTEQSISPVTLTPERHFLSPNSFVSNSCVPEHYLSAVQNTPILSPEQFYKENCLTSQSDSFLNEKLAKSWLSTSHNSSKSSNSLAIPELQFSSEQINTECINPDNVPTLNSRLTYCVKKKQPVNVKKEKDGHLLKGIQKPPVMSATVTKVRAKDRKENPEHIQPRSRRRLENIASEGEEVESRSIVFQDPPAINISSFSCPPVGGLPNGGSTSNQTVLNRKRKSQEFLGTNCSIKGSELCSFLKVKRTHLSKPALLQGKPSQRKIKGKQALKPEKTLKTSNAKPNIINTRPAGPPKQHMAVTFKNSKRVVAVPQSKLIFTKAPKTVIPRHPMPFAAKNMFYDERWMAKQERGFTWWLNFILTPDDFAVKKDPNTVNAAVLILGAENSYKTSMPRAPTKEEVSLKAYTTRCKLNRLRRAACRLFTSDSVVKAILRLEVEIEARRLLVRKDRHLWKDIGERQKILNWLLSYNSLWLRIGLETIFGELIALESNSDLTGLAMFILNRLLWNPDIGSEYRHPSVPHLYREGHEEALSKFTLKKLLLLVFFLDHAKQSRLIDHDPCLFWKDAEFKTSKDLLLAFSRDFLSGEGDLSRHLSYLGLPVGHVQTPLDEFDFAVTNLAVDLQCGIRLVRVMELLSKNWSLSKKLRVPAISRLQKMHNVEVALKALTEKGVRLDDERGVSITSKDIVDRHRERTLALLWRIVFAFQVDVLLSVKQLKEEIQFLKQSYSTQKKLAALRTLSNPVTARKSESDYFVPNNYNERVLLLMDWVNAVCKFYNSKVENFTVSFSDGRVFCYLINHYHPNYLPLGAVCQSTTQTTECSESGTVMLNSSSDSDNSLDIWPGVSGVASSSQCKELLENELNNYNLVQTAVSNLGGIPSMVHHSDMSNTIPDEKIVITFLSFLCARLFDLRKEARAARVIQAAWREHKLKSEQSLLERKHKAARVIQSAMLRFVTRRRLYAQTISAIIIQKHWRRYRAQQKLKELKYEKQKELMIKASVIIQKYWRGYIAQKVIFKTRNIVISMQARVRAKIAYTSYKRLRRATILLQMHVRSWLLCKRERWKYLQLKSAAVVIQLTFKKWRREKIKRQTESVLILQRLYRKWKARKLICQNAATIKIQSLYRMHRERKKYLNAKCKIIKIQAWFRSYRVRQAFLTQKKHVVTLQKYYRAYRIGQTERKMYLEIRSAAVSIQTFYRGMRARRIKAACVLQSYWRMRQQKKMYLRVKQLVIMLQSNVRKYLQQKQLKQMKKAACVIQYHYRSYVATKRAVQRYKQVCWAAAVIQSAFRKIRRQRTELQQSAVRIQSQYRAYVTRKNFLQMKAAAVKIQSVFKMKQRLKQYHSLRNAALSVQQRFRANKIMYKQQEEYRKSKIACIKLQAAVRQYIVRKEIQSWHKAAIVLQAQYKMRSQRKQYLLYYTAVVCIQKQYRAHKRCAHQRAYFLSIKQSVNQLQAAYRGYRVRKRLKSQIKAAMHIQTTFRAYMIRNKYSRMKQAAMTIQRWYRCTLIGKKERKTFLSTQRAVVTIQAAYRAWVTRKQLLVWHMAAVCIQSVFRRHAAQKQFKKIKAAALTIQKHYRAVLASREQRERYLETCKNIKKVQALWRGWAIRKGVQMMHKSATLIQSFYRMHICRTKYNTVKQASLKIQKYYRAQKARRTSRSIYLKMKKSAIVLQSAYRGWKVRKHIQNKHKAAIIIQTKFRSFRLKKIYMTIRTATLTIQRCYCALMLSRLQRTEFLNVRRSAITLQAAFRGVKVRKQILLMHKSAIVIQSHFRMQSLRVKYQAMRQAAVLIQRQYRALLNVRKERKHLDLQKATCTLQAAWRGRRVRENLKSLHKAATLIQSQYRTIKHQKYYKELREAARKIQSKYRACRKRNQQLHQYLSMRSAALCIQSAFRGMKVRQDLQAKHTAATLIQRQYKCFLERKRFVILRNAAVLIQQKFKLKVHTKQERKRYMKLKESAVVLQAAYRGWKERKKMNLLCQSATLIQSTFRMHKEKVSYQAMKRASVIIQQQYRTYMLGRSERKMYLKQRRAVIHIQASYRGMKERKKLSIMKKAATKIQAHVKMCHYRSQYVKIQCAVRVIQQRFRANKLRDVEVTQYCFVKNAALCIQASFRGWRTRKELKRRNDAAKEIQRYFRTFIEHKHHVSVKEAAVVIQRWYRASVLTQKQCMHFQSVLKATVCIQSSYRGFKVRNELRVKHKMATIIQSAYKMYVQKKYYKHFLQAVHTVQQKYRANKARDFHLSEYQTARRAAIVLQAAFWGMKTRIWIQQMHRAAAKIQGAFKSFTIRKKYVALRSATVLIQRQYRALLLVKTEQQKFLVYRKAAVCIQAAYRGFKDREKLKCRHRAASLIQSVYRMHRSFQSKKWAALVIQKNYKRYRIVKLEQRNLIVCKAAITIQALYRGNQSRRRLREMQKAATVLQANYRMHRERKCYLALLHAVRTVQQRFRANRLRNEAIKRYNNILKAVKYIQSAFVSRKLARDAKSNLAALVIQAAWKTYKERKAFVRIKEAALIIQAAFRAHRTRKLLKEIEASACLIQTWYRKCHQARLQRVQYLSMRNSAIKIQSAFRGMLIRREAQKEQAARKVRSFLLMTPCRRRFLRLKAAAIVVQSHYRMQRIRRVYEMQRESALVLQQYQKVNVTLKHQRTAYMENQKQVLQLQTEAQLSSKRRKLSCIEINEITIQISAQNRARHLLKVSYSLHLHLCAMKIQRRFRAHLALKHAEKHIDHVTLIQRWFRSKMQRKNFIIYRHKILIVQRAVHSWLRRRNSAAQKIQNCVRSFLRLRRQTRVLRGIIKLQAIWRGYIFRKNKDTKAIRQIRRRLHTVNQDVKEENKLWNRTMIAVEYLLTYKQLSFILAALQHLEVATRLSSLCCENMAQSGAIKTIFVLIRNCNRSIPCMEVIKLSVMVLLNLSKYEKTVQAVYEVENSVDILLGLMQIYREKAGDKVSDKGGSIFTKTCCLLAIFAMNSQKAREIRSIPRAIDRIKSIYKLTCRKHKMDAERSVCRQRMSDKTGSNLHIQATPVRTRVVSRIKPDWVLRKDNMREIVDPLHAVRMVMDTLGVPS